MEGIVAKRSLKKSYYTNKKKIPKCALPFETRKKEDKSKQVTSRFKEYKSRYLYKLSLQSITMISLIIFVLGIKYFNITVVKEADITKKIINLYKTSYSFSQIKETAQRVLKKTYTFVSPIIPDKIKNKVINSYKYMRNNKSNEKFKEVTIYEETSYNYEKDKENERKDSIGTSVEDEFTIATASSEVSSEFEIANKIKATNIIFVAPIKGTITSRFGAREVIFEGIDSYHTGIDIAAKTGTNILSSIDGIVTVATFNKYNGNYVEVTSGKVVTKYLHMSKISVKKGDTVKAKDKIGEVGSTGLATGPHLHFEIVYDGVKIDPELILAL